MLCILGCSRAHHSTKGYILMTLVVVAIIFSIRVLIDRCFLRPGQQGGSPTPSAVDEFEMRLARAALAMHRNQQHWRWLAATTEFPQQSRAENWQSKLVITAGSDYASHIAHPCPFRERPG
ncbi:hypothetical protein HPP92_007937 [Vanilla planifolia]|uniref:Uncharacterized protein n=1 Tax=Vanilla planifolia TaxID=51239 RepID=A0A835RGX8_VANPL|nr:hypothetical protein HPP92_007937 [Vanilla planifolia]